MRSGQELTHCFNKAEEMKIFIRVVFFASLIFNSLPVAMAETGVHDKRISLGLTPAEKVEFLKEMRQMLVSIQGIMAGMGEGNREKIIESARYSGNRMARATPGSITKKLPQSFKSIGGPTHMMFEELVIRAETDDMDMLAEFTGQLMQQCVACHNTFKAD